MKYTATLNGRTYEIEIERTDVFRPLTSEEIAAGVVAPAAPITVSAPKAAAAPLRLLLLLPLLLPLRPLPLRLPLPLLLRLRLPPAPAPSPPR